LGPGPGDGEGDVDGEGDGEGEGEGDGDGDGDGEGDGAITVTEQLAGCVWLPEVTDNDAVLIPGDEKELLHIEDDPEQAPVQE